LEPKLEPFDVSEGKWRALFLVIGTDTIDESFIREIRNINQLSSKELVIDGYPAHQYVYEGTPHKEIYKVKSIIDIEDDSELDDAEWITDRFRFQQTTVEVGDKFYTLLYAADVNYFTRYEAVAYSLAETMRFGFFLPLQASHVSGPVVTASNGNQTLFAYCESDSSNTLLLKTARLTTGRTINSPVTVKSFPSEISECSAAALAFDGTGYLLAYAIRSNGHDTLHAHFLNNQGEAIDQGQSLDTVNVTEGPSTLGFLKALHTGQNYFLTWVRHQVSNGESYTLEGLLLDGNYNTSDLKSYATDLIVTENNQSQRLDVAHTGDTIALAWNFPEIESPSPTTTKLRLLGKDGQQLAEDPIVVRSTSDAELRDPTVTAQESTISVFWVERRTAIDDSSEHFDDQILGRQYSMLGESLQPTPTQIMGAKTETGIRREKYKLQVKPYADTFYILWDSNRVVSDLYHFAVNSDLTLRSDAKLLTTVSSGTHQLLGFHNNNESYAAWLPTISLNFLQIWPFSRDDLTSSSWVMTESLEP
jgi:hypothetical protein